jgi:uncharacterized membrane protein
MLYDWLQDILYVSMRWLHVVATTLIVGGTLFFEFVIPIAIEDFKSEQRLTVLGRARWVFKRVVVAAAFLLLVSGATSVYRMWDVYRDPAYKFSGYFAAIHAAIGVLALVVALALTVPRSPPDRPIGWMRINLGILLVALLAATLARHVRLSVRDGEVQSPKRVSEPQSLPGGGATTNRR